MERKKRAGLTMLTLDQRDFKTKPIKIDTGGHLLILKGKIHPEDINIVNIYSPNIGAPKYIRYIFQDFKKDIVSNTCILGDFNTSPSTMDDRPSKQNVNKNIVALRNALDQIYLTDIYIETLITKKQNTHSFQT